MNITPEQWDELKQMSRKGKTPYMRIKALALLNIADGRKVTEIAQVLRISRQAIHAWMTRYEKEGIAGLYVRPGRGTKAKADYKELEDYVRQSPRNFGIQRTRWTLAALAKAVPSLKGFSPYGVQKALRRIGIHYKRGRAWIHSPDPDYAQKKRPLKKR